MTNEERAALRALEVAATPGPWWYEYSTVDDLHWGPMGAHRLHRLVDPGDPELCGWCRRVFRAKAPADETQA